MTAVGLASPSGAHQRPGVTERISLSSTGAEANNDSLDQLAMTPDGRYVAFTSTASDLVPDDTNGAPDIFVRDRVKGTTRIASLAWNGKPGTTVPPSATCGASYPSISDDGRFVAFEGCFTNLIPGPKPKIPGDTNHAADIFVRDMKTGSVVRASVTDKGAETLPGSGSSEATISGDGRYVVFQTAAKTMVASQCPVDPVQNAICTAAGGFAQVFVRDLVKRTTTMVSVSSGGQPADGQSMDASISRNGRFVAFTSTADNLVSNDVNACNPGDGVPSCPEIFVRDLVAHTTEIITLDVDGRSATNVSGRTGTVVVQALSADGRFVVFRSQAAHLVPNDGPSGWAKAPTGVYVRDRMRKRTERASVDSTGAIVLAGAHPYSISPDGRFVGLWGVQDLACPQQAGVVGVHDRVTGAIDPVGAVDYRGRTDCSAPYASNGQISIGGRYVCFISAATNLVAGDKNSRTDVFVRDRGDDLGISLFPGAHVSSRAAASPSTPMDAKLNTGGTSSLRAGQGGELLSASLIRRPQLRDLFVRLELSHMPVVTAAPNPFSYVLDLGTTSGDSFELRVDKPGAAARFGLYRQTAAGWSLATELAGGYGTTGQEIVAAIPWSLLHLDTGVGIAHAEASVDVAAVEEGQHLAPR